MDDMFDKIFSDLATSAAKVQVEHYNALVAEGMDAAEALELTAKTSSYLFKTVDNARKTFNSYNDIIQGVLRHFE